MSSQKVDGYQYMQSQISKLQFENAQLLESKFKLIKNTAKEIDRLRKYIYSLTITIQQLKKENIIREENKEEKEFITPDYIEADYIQDDEKFILCQHCGNITNITNMNISTSSSSSSVNNDIAPGDIVEYEEYEEEEEEVEEEEKEAYIVVDIGDEEEDEKETITTRMSDHYDHHITPGRVSRVTRGNSVLLDPNDLPTIINEQSMGEHADIPLPENLMDDAFVICDYCTNNLPLQFVRKYPDTIECSKCLEFFEFIFLCNECGKCVCADCYEFEAKMQSIDRVAIHFVEKNINNKDDDGYSFKLILFQQKLNEEASSTIHKLIGLNCGILNLDEFSLKLCFIICSFMDDMDLCTMSENKSLSAELFHIYWILSPPKLSFKKKFGFSDINLLNSLKWADNNQSFNIKQVIDNDIMISNYLSKHYQKITFNSFVTKLTKYMNETNTNYLKLLDLLQLVVKIFNIDGQCEMLQYQQFAWRELGGSPSLCSKGTYYVWNIPILQRSFCFNLDDRILDKPMNR